MSKLPSGLLERLHDNGKQTQGGFELRSVVGELLFSCDTLELPWLDNARKKSCIPKGRYTVVPRRSPKHGQHYEVIGVQGRSLVLVHVCNYVRELEGCIGVGKGWQDLDGDGLMDLGQSRATMKKLLAAAPDGFLLEIV